MGGTIVCGVGDTPEGRSAAELAGALSGRLGLRVVLVSVVESVPEARVRGAARLEREGYQGETLKEIAQRIGDGTEIRVVHGQRADALAEVAAEEGADMILVGSRPGGLGSRKLRAGLARELEAVTRVPVLVAPPATRKRSRRRLEVAAETTEC